MAIHAAAAGRFVSRGLSSAPATQVLPIVINPTSSIRNAELTAQVKNLLALSSAPFGPPTARVFALADSQDGRILIPCVNDRMKPRVKCPLPALLLVTHTGPDAGHIEELRPGRYWLGRPDPDTALEGTGILISDPSLSRVHARIEVDAQGVQIFDRGSSNGLWVDGKRVNHAWLSTMSRARAGDTLFRLHVPASDTGQADGWLENTGTGSAPQPVDCPVEIEGTPPQRPGAGTLAAAFLPLGLGLALAAATGMWFFLAFSGIGALTAGAGLLSYRRRLTAFRCAEGKAREADRRRRHFLQPTLGDRCLAALAGSAFGESIQLEPAPNSTNHTRNPLVALRLGTGSVPADLVLRSPSDTWRPPVLDAVPVVLEARAGCTVCVSGASRNVQGLVRSLLLQLGTSAAPDRPAAALLGATADELTCDARFIPGIHLVPAKHASAAAAALADLAASRPGYPLIAVAPPGLWDTARGIWDILPEQTRQLTCLIACRDPDAPPLPRDADPAIALDRDGGTLAQDNQRQHFVPDLLGARSFHRAALQLAGASAGTPPETDSPLFPEPAGKAWREDRPFRAVIGYAGGHPVSLDLVQDGPHILVAGTTGSGKSELLRTFVCSLSCRIPPTRLNFLLIDFKGGSGLAPLAELPHTAGFLTDLSQENVARAMTSLRAELRRRESLLAEVRASDLDEFNARAIPGAELPRLVVVVDEFRMLADAVPNAVQELMKIAALGRSLGLHLILATQRPQGAVTADIRANVSAAICLRVQSALDSRDVIGCDDAAAISASSPGKAILRLAGGPPLTFRAASTAANDPNLPLVQTLADFLSAPARTAAPSGPGLKRIVEGLKAAAVHAGFPEHGQAPVKPPLPVELCSRPVPSAGSLRIGLADQPARQAQQWLDWDPDQHGHLALIGLPRAGPAAAASTLARQHLANLPGRHLYVLDGDGSLAWAARHPQVGACVPPHDTARASRVLSMLADVLLERLADQPNAAGITVLVSGWGRWQESFRSTKPSPAEDALLSLARDGTAADICLLVSGNRELTSARFFQLLPNRLWFPAGLSHDALLTWPRMPELNPLPGRAFVQGPLTPGTGEGLMDGTADGSETLVQCYQRGWPAEPAPLPEGIPHPRRIDGLPRTVLFSDLEAASGPYSFPVGMGGDELKTIEAQVPPGSVFTVLGPPGSGKTTLLKTFAAAGRLSPACEGAPTLLPRICWVTPAKGITGTNGSIPPPTGSLEGWLVLADDADQLPAEVHQVIAQLLARGAGIVLSAVPAFNLLARLPALNRVRLPANGALLAPVRDSDGEFFGVRMAVEGRPAPGRGYLLAGGSPVEVRFAVPG